jgi:hypothetical protein
MLDIGGLTPEFQQQVRDLCSKYGHIQQGQNVLQKADVAYLDPTFDKTFKWLTGSDNPDIARTICKSLMFLTNKSLAARGVRSMHSLSTETDKRSEQLSKLPGSSLALLMMDVPVELDLFANLYGFSQTIVEKISSALNKSSNQVIMQGLEGIKSSLEKDIYDVLHQTTGNVLPSQLILNFIGDLRGFENQLGRSKNGDGDHDRQIDTIQALLDELEQAINPNNMLGLIETYNKTLWEQLTSNFSQKINQLTDTRINLKKRQKSWESDFRPDLCTQTDRAIFGFIDSVRQQIGDNFFGVSNCRRTWVMLEDALSGIEITDEMAGSIKRLKADYDKVLAIDEELRAIAMTSIPSVLNKDDILQKLRPIKQQAVDNIQGFIEQIQADEEHDQATKEKLTQILQQWQRHINSSVSIDDLQEILKRFNKITVDIEMQRKKDIIEARILQYGAHLLLSKEAENLLPLVLISICGWNNPEVIHDVFGGVLDSGTKEAVPIFQETIYLQTAPNPIGKNADQRKIERKRIKNVFKASLRQRHPELIKESESFKSLWIPQPGDDVKTQIEKQNLRTAYEVLCFLRLAPLTPQLISEGNDKDPNPDKVDNGLLQTRIFNPIIRKAYNLMKTNNVNTPGAQEQYLGIWSQRDEIEKQQQTIIKQQQRIAEATIDSFLKYNKSISSKTVKQWAGETFSNPNNSDIRQVIFDQAMNREEEFKSAGCEDAVIILQTAYSQAERDVGQDKSDDSSRIRSNKQPKKITFVMGQR